MSDYGDSLRELRDLAIARLKEVLTEKKPSYNVDGQRFDWAGYAKELREEIRELNDELREEEQKSEPFEFETASTTGYPGRCG